MLFPEEVLGRIEENSRREFLPIIGREKAETVFRILTEIRPCRPLEIGVMTGYATAVIASVLPEGCRVVGIEISAALAERARENLSAAGLADRVRILRGDVREELGSLGDRFDFVLLDGQKTGHLGILRKLEGKLVHGATVIANCPAGNRQKADPYLDYLGSSPLWETRHQPVGDGGLEISRFLGGA
ncbi:class I SAM-dependent methyltransferase [Candidatus Uhrbacteria bacterium]|nr:class I SAM-dependent methyltransferase [Candidatus Uhrbacteria bacterium]